MKTFFLRAAALSLVATTAFTAPISPADARPPYCIGKAWAYADRQTGGDRSSPDWDYYNYLFQDYNECETPYACNDVERACVDPR